MKVVIVGGVAGGATAAARLRRLDEQAEIVIFERLHAREHIKTRCSRVYNKKNDSYFIRRRHVYGSISILLIGLYFFIFALNRRLIAKIKTYKSIFTLL